MTTEKSDCFDTAVLASANEAYLTIRYFFACLLRGVGIVPPGYNARMIPILGSMVSPPRSTTSINAWIAARHANVSCSRIGSLAM